MGIMGVISNGYIDLPKDNVDVVIIVELFSVLLMLMLFEALVKLFSEATLRVRSLLFTELLVILLLLLLLLLLLMLLLHALLLLLLPLKTF